MLWRGHEIGKVCEPIDAQGADRRLVLRRREPRREPVRIAAAHLSVRFVLGFGRDLPDGVVSLDEAIADGRGSAPPIETPTREGPALITFTARAGVPFLPVVRREDELLAQGAMTVLALDLDTRDVILNPYPLTGPVGLSLGLMAWLISGATLVQHQPFDYDAFVAAAARQRRDGDGAAGADPGRACQGRRAAPAVMPLAAARRGVVDARASRAAAAVPARRRCCSTSIRSAISRAWCCAARRAGLSRSRRPVNVVEDDEGAVFVETQARTRPPKRARDGEILLRGPVVPRGAPGPARPRCRRLRRDRAARRDRGGMAACLRIKRDPELLHHGGVALAASELDELYQSFPGFLDAACFVLSDPIVGDRIFAAVVPQAGRADLARGAAPVPGGRGRSRPTNSPTRLLVVKQIPRDADGARAARTDPAAGPQAARFTAPAILTRRFSRSRAPASRSSGVSQLA